MGIDRASNASTEVKTFTGEDSYAVKREQNDNFTQTESCETQQDQIHNFTQTEEIVLKDSATNTEVVTYEEVLKADSNGKIYPNVGERVLEVRVGHDAKTWE